MTHPSPQSRAPSPRSKSELRGQLHDSWVEGGGAGQECRIANEGPRRSGERVLRGVDRAEIRTIGKVECLEDQPQPGALPKIDVAREAHVHLREVRTGDRVAPYIGRPVDGGMAVVV